MIIGTGNDITDIRRIEGLLTRFGNRFEAKCFTHTEQQKAQSRNTSGKQTAASTYAKRFAAKEACSKALGTGFGKNVSWHDIEIDNLPNGKPAITLNGSALHYLQHLTPAGMDATIHLALSDEYPYALAHVLIEAIPESATT